MGMHFLLAAGFELYFFNQSSSSNLAQNVVAQTTSTIKTIIVAGGVNVTAVH